MDKKKSVLQPSSSSEESSSGEEDEGFVRSDRNGQKMEDKKAHKSDDESESEEGDEDEDEDDDEIDGTQRAKADEASSSEDKQPSHREGESDSDSETSSASLGKPTKPSHQFLVLPRKAENGNGHSGKKAPKPEKSSKSDVMLEASSKKGKDKASKRDREVAAVSDKGSSKKQKKERSDVAGESVPKAKDSEKVSKDKSIPSSASEKKNGSKKFAHATAIAEKPDNAPTQHNSAKKPESASAKKAAEKGKFDKKAAQNADAEAAKGSLSPTKPKLFTGKDEVVLTSEILHDIQKGIEIPTKKTDGYWRELAERVEERMEGSWSKEQLCDKFKRMKNRYNAMAEKFRDNGERKFRHSIDQELFAMWDQIWGNGEVTKADDSGDAKNKQTKVLAAASPVKGGKASKIIAPVQVVKLVAEESEGGHKGNADASESEESDDDSDSPKKELIVTPMEVDLKDAHADHILVPQNLADNADNALSHSVSGAQQVFHKEIQATLAEIQESSRQTLKEWQSKALAVVENAVKAVADQARITSGFGMGGFDGLSSPLRSLDMRDLRLSEGDQALQQQWHELRLKELDLYRQRLELMQRECLLKQDQMKAQLHKNK